MKVNKILIIRLITALIIWSMFFFIGIIIPRRLQYNTLWPIFSKMFLYAAKIKTFYMGKFDVRNTKNIFYAVNHRSFADSFIITNLLRKPFSLVFINWMTKNPVFKFFTDKMGLISLDQTDLIQQKKSIEKINKTLKKKYSMIFFPEGRFVHDKPIGQLKKGIIKIAKETNCIIVPLVIYGSGIEKDFLYENKLKWKSIYVDSGKQLKYGDYNDDETFLNDLTSIMKKMYIDLEKKFSI